MNKPEKKGLVPPLRFPEFKDAGEWNAKQLGSICQPQQWATISSSDLVEAGYPVYGANGFIGYYTEFNHEFETVAVTCRGSTCGEVSLIPPESYITGNSMCLDGINADQNSYHFVYQLLKNRGFRDVISGSAQPQIVGSAIKRMMIALPQPAEQQKIADCLTSVDELITAQTQKLDALKTHKKGLMLQLFPAEGETVPKRRFPEFRGAGEWASKPLAKVCNVLQGYGFPEVLQGKNDGKYPFCKVSDISRAVAENGGLLAEATNYVGDDELLKLRARLIPKGATVFAKIGEALRLNRRAYVQKECLIDNNATGLKAIDGVAVDYFVYLLSQLIDLNKHCGGAVPSVNKSTLEEIAVIVPGPDEQKRIANCLMSLDELISAQIQKIEGIKAYKKGLLQQLLPNTKLSNL